MLSPDATITFPVLLASQSPRRAELLAQIGIPFNTVSIDVPEVRSDDESPYEYVTRLSADKALAGAERHIGHLVLGADTIVEHQGNVFEKPYNENEGIDMLMQLSESVHQVHTAVAIARVEHISGVLTPHIDVDCVTSQVHFRKIERQEASDYWATGEPCDKAGGYGIQGFGGVFVEHLMGSYSAVMGLPVAQTQQLLAKFGVPYWQKNSNFV